MNWNTKEEVDLLERAVAARHAKFYSELRTDRKNLSEIWNRHIKEIGISLIRHSRDKVLTIHDIIGLINFRNPDVSDALCIRNPDRTGQFLLVPRDIASKIMMLGMP
jgi:hypothetical protein